MIVRAWMSMRTARLPARRAPVVVAKVRVVEHDEVVRESLTCLPLVGLKLLCKVKQDRHPDLAKMVSLWPWTRGSNWTLTLSCDL